MFRRPPETLGLLMLLGSVPAVLLVKMIVHSLQLICEPVLVRLRPTPSRT